MLFFNIKGSMVASAIFVFSSFSAASSAASSDLPPPVEPGFYWTDWLNSDNPALTGDWEVLAHFGPDVLCDYPIDIEAKITDATLYSPLDTTPDTLAHFDASKGLICRNADQPDGKCSDYKVRFMCQVGTWTDWLNADRPTLTGDWETLDSNDNTLRCDNPTDIRARVVGTNTVISTSASAPDQLAAFGITGLVCKNSDQTDSNCEDYEIRFLCPDNWNTPEPDAVSDEIDFAKFTDESLRQCVADTGKTTISELTQLRCDFLPIYDASGIEQLTALTSLDLSFSYLANIDVSKNTALTHLDISRNRLTTIDVSNNTALVWLNLMINDLTDIIMPETAALTALSVSNNKLTNIDLSNYTELSNLSIECNNLTNIDLSSNKALTDLIIHDNQLSNIDLSNNRSIELLALTNNVLTGIDLSNNTALYQLSILNNPLTGLDVSGNSALRILNVDEHLIPENTEQYHNTLIDSDPYYLRQYCRGF